MNFINYALRVSRFRFWIYTGGTYVVGYVLGANILQDFFRWEYILYFFYFFIPANIFIYGVNDYWDVDTDKNNPKKNEKEEKLTENKKNSLIAILLTVTVFSFGIMFFQNSQEKIIFSLFLFLSYFYSAKPLRFKAIPILDFSSNMLYIIPGIFGYYLSSGYWPNTLLVIAGYLHISAMHIFSAIPDIKFDQKAGIKTTAVMLGSKNALIVCLFYWTGLTALVIYLTNFYFLSFLILLFPCIPLLLLTSSKLKIEKVYWYLPILNIFLGGILTLVLLFTIIF
jgi:lycopene elongase/hydratase (dihydrobisanhydrobacterioruberin-forming)